MNTRPQWSNLRSRSVPLPSRSRHSRSRNAANILAALDKLRMQAKKLNAEERRQVYVRARELPVRPQLLMPRVEIMDDISSSKLVVRLEIPDVDPSNVHMKLNGTLLSVYGERVPDLDAVGEEYRDGLRFHSQARMGSTSHRPKVIILGGGRVGSVPSDQIHLGTEQQQHPTHNTPASPLPVRVAAERVHYNELRYGAFCRNLRVPLGTTAADITGTFANGMLVLSWPKVSVQAVAEKSPKEDATDVTITIASSTPVTVKVESFDVDSQE